MSGKKYPIDRNTAPEKRGRTARDPNRATESAFALATHTAAKDARGGDPYNTSGSFDRTQNWARVGKR